MLKFFKRIPLVSACIALAVSLIVCGCIEDANLCPPETGDDKEKGITVEFSLVTKSSVNSKSRTLLSAPDTEKLGYLTENFLDLQNLVFLLFDDQGVVIRAFKPYIEVDDVDTYVRYSVRAFLNDSYFLDTTSTEISFSIAVVGNYRSLSPLGFDFHAGMTMSEVFDRATVATFAMPLSNNAQNCWIPSIYPTTYVDAAGESIPLRSAAHIPMAGMQTFRVSTNELKASTVDKPLNLSSIEDKNINMLRALAKIEVIDHIDAVTEGDVTKQPDASERISINSVELVGHTVRGSIFPDLSLWQRSGLETQYVTQPSIPDGVSFLGYNPPYDDLSLQGASPGTVVGFFADRIATEERQDKCRVYSCYLTDYDPNQRGSIPAMWIRIAAKHPYVDPESNSDISYCRLEVAPYDEAGAGEEMSIVRNNIYRFQINKITPPDQNNQIIYTTCPMGNYTSDIPTFE